MRIQKYRTRHQWPWPWVLDHMPSRLSTMCVANGNNASTLLNSVKIKFETVSWTNFCIILKEMSENGSKAPSSISVQWQRHRQQLFSSFIIIEFGRKENPSERWVANGMWRCGHLLHSKWKMDIRFSLDIYIQHYTVQHHMSAGLCLHHFFLSWLLVLFECIFLCFQHLEISLCESAVLRPPIRFFFFFLFSSKCLTDWNAQYNCHVYGRC